MNSQTEKNSICDDVLEAIKNGKITMQPRWHFILKTALAIVGIIILLLTLLYLVSFVIFTTRESGLGFIPTFGKNGWWEFFASLPWLLISLSIFFIIILEILVRRFAFCYRQPMLFSAVVIIIFSLIGGITIASTQFHRALLRSAEDDSLPLAGGFYRNFGYQKSNLVQVGAIVDLTENGFVIQNHFDEMIDILVDSKTSFPSGLDFVEGDTVVVFGTPEKNSFRAMGIKKVSDEFGPRSPLSNKHRPLYPALLK